MIVVRAPLRISFVGGGTDLPDFYRAHTGRVISATIDKYVYLVINRTPMIKSISARYSICETVNHPDELEHTRIREALNKVGIMSNIEIGSFASIPGKTGLGSSSSFSVALLKGLHHLAGKKLSPREAAEAACWLEIDALQEPIGKQDQYATAIGGFNIFQFNKDDTVDINPVLLGYESACKLEDHMMLFFTGITRSASDVLGKQRTEMDKKIKVYQDMAAQVPFFETALLAGNIEKMASMMHEGWLMKKSLTEGISSSLIDNFYEEARKSGAWGGKVLGAGGGGCILMLVPPEKHKSVREKMLFIAKENNLNGFQEIPVKFVQSGAEVLLNDTQGNDDC